MKVTDKVMESVINELVGEDALSLVNVLKGEKNLSEFKISAKIKIPVDTIRNQLYRLYNYNLVSFIRKKDKKKGWYIYYWTLNTSRIKYLVTDLKKRRLEKLNAMLKREQDSHFFSCKNNCIRVDFEQATNFEYKCPECGELLQQEDNVKNMEKIRNEISELKKDLEIKSESELSVRIQEENSELENNNLDNTKNKKRKNK